MRITPMPELHRLRVRNATCAARGHAKRYVGGNGSTRCWGCHQTIGAAA